MATEELREIVRRVTATEEVREILEGAGFINSFATFSDGDKFVVPRNESLPEELRRASRVIPPPAPFGCLVFSRERWDRAANRDYTRGDHPAPIKRLWLPDVLAREGWTPEELMRARASIGFPIHSGTELSASTVTGRGLGHGFAPDRNPDKVTTQYWWLESVVENWEAAVVELGLALPKGGRR